METPTVEELMEARNEAVRLFPTDAARALAFFIAATGLVECDPTAEDIEWAKTVKWAKTVIRQL